MVGVCGFISQIVKIWDGRAKKYFYDGWFSELCFGEDEINTNKKDDILKIIENKEIHFSDGKVVRYNEQECLTPALWLEVPEGWKNIQQ
ncbi:MAG: hypothetical protein IPO36_01410 [Anaerolineales bacterium]|nr:hypothetical protein [Anaerolineales bacterium]